MMMRSVIIVCLLTTCIGEEAKENGISDDDYMNHQLNGNFGGLSFDEAELPHDPGHQSSEHYGDEIPHEMMLQHVEAFSNGLTFDESKLEEDPNSESTEHHGDEIPPEMVIRHVDAFSNGLKFDETNLPHDDQQTIDAPNELTGFNRMDGLSVYVDLNGVLHVDRI